MQGYKAKSEKRKGMWGESQRQPDARNQLSGFLQQCLMAHVKCCLPGALLRPQDPKSLLGLVAWAPPSLPLPGFQTPRRRAGFSINTLHSLGTGSLSYQFGRWREPSYNPSSQMPAKGSPCKQAFLRTAVAGMLSNSFLHMYPGWESALAS